MSFDQQNPTPLTPEEEPATVTDPTEIETREDVFNAFEQPVRPDEKKPKRKGKLSKRARTLLFTSLAAGVLAIAVIAVTLLPAIIPHEGSADSNPANSDANSDNTITLLDKTPADKETAALKNVTITNKEDSYSFRYNTTDQLYEMVDYEDLTMNAGNTGALSDYLTVIYADSKLEDASNLADFGLDKPAATVTATYYDGQKATLYVGNETPSKNSHYIRLKDKEGVYIASSDVLSPFLAEKEAYVSTTLITAPSVKKDDQNGAAVLREVSLSGKNHPQTLTVRRRLDADGGELALHTYLISEPIKRSVSTAAGNALAAFTSLNAGQTIVMHPTAKQKQVLGFDDPLLTIRLTMAVESVKETSSADSSAAAQQETIYYNNTKYTLTVGNKDEKGNYLVMLDGVDVIFLVEADVLSGIAERTYDNTVSNILFLKDIKELGKIEVAADGKARTFTLTHHPEEEERDNTLTVTSDGKKYPTEDFRTLYQFMMSIERYGSLKGEPEGKLKMRLKLWDTSGKHFLTADIYAASGSVYHVRTSDGEQFTTRTSSITHFLKQYENYLNGDPVFTITY